MGKISKRLLPLNISKLSKKEQKKEDKAKKLYKANKFWNDWKLQLNWSKLKWVHPRTLNKRNKPF